MSTQSLTSYTDVSLQSYDCNICPTLLSILHCARTNNCKQQHGTKVLYGFHTGCLPIGSSAQCIHKYKSTGVAVEASADAASTYGGGGYVRSCHPRCTQHVDVEGWRGLKAPSRVRPSFAAVSATRDSFPEPLSTERHHFHRRRLDNSVSQVIATRAGTVQTNTVKLHRKQTPKTLQKRLTLRMQHSPCCCASRQEALPWQQHHQHLLLAGEP